MKLEFTASNWTEARYLLGAKKLLAFFPNAWCKAAGWGVCYEQSSWQGQKARVVHPEPPQMEEPALSAVSLQKAELTDIKQW